jgi:hypothetical protein
VSEISESVRRVREWLDQFATLGGVDPEIAHRANHAELRTSDLRRLLDAVGDGEPTYYLPADFDNRFREIARGVVVGELDERLRLATMLMRQVVTAFPVVAPTDDVPTEGLVVLRSHDIDERCALCESDTEPFDTASSRFHFGPRRRRP